MNWACNSRFVLRPTTWGPGEGLKVKNLTKSISKIFILLSQTVYKPTVSKSEVAVDCTSKITSIT